MDASNSINKSKTVDFMANNLVEHQVFTVKETIERDKGEFHLLYFDFFKDMNLEKSNLNYYFFAIKKSTYELAKCHEMVCENDEEIEEALFKKNIHIVMVDHGQAIHRVNTKHSFRNSLRLVNDYIVKSKRLIGLNRMILLMALLNVYYISILLAILGITDLDIPYIIISLLMLHVLFYLSLREYAKHHVLAYIFAPFTLFLFNWAMIIGLLKRKFATQTEDLVVEEQPDDLPEALLESESEETVSDESEETVSDGPEEKPLEENEKASEEPKKKEPSKPKTAEEKKPQEAQEIKETQ
jgi:hypothetical protein